MQTACYFERNRVLIQLANSLLFYQNIREDESGYKEFEQFEHYSTGYYRIELGITL